MIKGLFYQPFYEGTVDNHPLLEEEKATSIIEESHQFIEDGLVYFLSFFLFSITSSTN